MMYSYSCLSTFEQCPLKYKFRYIDKIEPEIPEPIEAFLGSRVHETLEKLYQDLKNDKIDTLEELVFFYQTQWQQKWNDAIVINNRNWNASHYQQMGISYITSYYNRHYPFDQTTTVDVEKHIIFNLDEDGNYKLQGYIDRLASKDKESIQIHDYKTNSRLPTIQELINNKQLSLYALGIKKIYPKVKDISLIWHFLKFDKELKIKKTEKELEKVKKETIQLINKIEASNIFPANPSFLCKWCEYQTICPQWSHLYMVNEESEEKSYHSNSITRLIDRYIELKKKKQQMKLDTYAEIESIEQKLIAHMKKKQTERVHGSTHDIKISKHHTFILPHLKSAKRTKLLHFLQEQTNITIEEELSDEKIQQILKDESWKPSQLTQLQKYVTIQTCHSFHILKKKN